ncbi:hypothetical protein J6590_056245 [Homalodisca vitripennis]|nr:hypothetical protein J6590_056245 [Homalodisca vitripennis]
MAVSPGSSAKKARQVRSNVKTVEDTLRRLIEGLLPDDREDEDTEQQREVRGGMMEESTGANEEDFTDEERGRS